MDVAHAFVHITVALDDSGSPGKHWLDRSDWSLLAWARSGAALQVAVETADPEHHARWDDPVALIAQLHNVPVRAGLVESAWDSPDTSHRSYLGLQRRPPWLAWRRGLELCGADDTGPGRCYFDELVRQWSKDTVRSVTTDAGRIPLEITREIVGPIDRTAARRRRGSARP